MNNTITFSGFTCNVNITEYRDGNAAISLDDATDGSPVATASVNIPEAKLPTGFIFIKNWSENEGMLDALVSAGIVEDTGRTFPCGFTDANLCKLVN